MPRQITDEEKFRLWTAGFIPIAVHFLRFFHRREQHWSLNGPSAASAVTGVAFCCAFQLSPSSASFSLMLIFKAVVVAHLVFVKYTTTVRPVSETLVVSRVKPIWLKCLGFASLGILTAVGFPLLLAKDIQALWGLPLVPSLQFAGTLVYCVATQCLLRLRASETRLLLLAGFSVAMSVVSLVLFSVGLAYPQTILGDVFLFQAATALIDSFGEFLLRHYVKATWSVAGRDRLSLATSTPLRTDVPTVHFG
ncbi:Fc.00g031760.m01.CDS01 [Cosmosporella sp. VM-42]